MLDWRIYFANGTTFCNEEGTWEDAPQDLIVSVPVRHELYGRKVLQSLDFFYKTLNGGPLDIVNCDDINPQLRLRCPWLKFGIGLANKDFKHILKQATEDPDFGPPRHPSRRSTDWGNIGI